MPVTPRAPVDDTLAGRRRPGATHGHALPVPRSAEPGTPAVTSGPAARPGNAATHVLAVPRRAIGWASLAVRTVARVPHLVLAVEALVADVRRTADEARTVVGLAHGVAIDAGDVATAAERLVARAASLVDLVEPALTDAGPTLRRAASAAEPRHVDALVELVELTPDLVDLIIPALRGMGGIGPEMEQLVERFESISQVVEGLPGAGRLKKRGQEQESDS